jgi:hypothetical protein
MCAVHFIQKKEKNKNEINVLVSQLSGYIHNNYSQHHIEMKIEMRNTDVPR